LENNNNPQLTLPHAEASLPDLEARSAPVPRFTESMAASAKPYRPLTPLDVCIAFWFAGACVFGTRLLVENIGFGRRLCRFLPIRKPEILYELEDCAAALGVRNRPTLIETDEVETPAVWGFWHKCLLMP